MVIKILLKLNNNNKLKILKNKLTSIRDIKLVGIIGSNCNLRQTTRLSEIDN